ncbi:MAG: hypothetical protein K2G88_01165, partial [Oscillospiraceae bacterium]|nr:hypothetical protein [Oscillospiraceae bacterium]
PGKSPFHGGFGLINADGIKKPAYWAYWMLNKLGSEVVEQSENHIITKSGNTYQIIIWNYCYYKDNFANGDRSELTETNRDNVFQNKDITIDLSIYLNGEYEKTIYTLDKSTSALHNWIKMDAPQYPTVNQIKELKLLSQPKIETSQINSFDISETLKPHQVKMYLISKI